MTRSRLDALLVARGHAASRERASALIMAGSVRVGDRVIDKPGAQIDAAAAVTVATSDIPYVSRGGVKLAGGLDALGIDVGDRLVLDVLYDDDGETFDYLQGEYSFTTLKVTKGASGKFKESIHYPEKGKPFGYTTAPVWKFMKPL